MIESRWLTRLFFAALCVPAVGSADADKLAAPPDRAITTARKVICTNLVSGARWQITIDLGNRTVDSNPARVSGDEISWHDSKDGGHYTLDRKSGQLTVIFASSTGGYFIHDRCSVGK